MSFLVLYLVAMSLDSEYVFGESYLSDLGVREGAWAFNSGLIIAGILFLLFDVMSIRSILGGSRLGIAALAMLVIGAAFLVSIGVFTEDAGDLHGIVSYGFFLSMLVALGLVTACMFRSRSLGRVGFAVSLVMFIVGILLLPMGGNPLSETIAVLGILAWGLLISGAIILKDRGYAIP